MESVEDCCRGYPRVRIRIEYMGEKPKINTHYVKTGSESRQVLRGESSCYHGESRDGESNESIYCIDQWPPSESRESRAVMYSSESRGTGESRSSNRGGESRGESW